jgi:hypothetical protein
VAATPIAALPYPALTDTPNGPAQILSLASAIDGQVVPRFATTGARDAAITAPVAGMVCWTTTPPMHWYYSGSVWVQAPIGPKELAYAEINASSANFTTIADVSGLSVSFTLTATRTVRIIASCLIKSTVAGDTLQVTIADPSNTVLITSGSVYEPISVANVRTEFSVRKVLTAASYTYKVRAERIAPGTGSCVINASAPNPSYIQAIDIT